VLWSIATEQLTTGAGGPGRLNDWEPHADVGGSGLADVTSVVVPRFVTVHFVPDVGPLVWHPTNGDVHSSLVMYG
jgi:hypothetical protein